MAVQDWRSALTVCLMIPQKSNAVIRRKLLFEVLSLKATRMILRQEKDLRFIDEELGIPKDYFSSSLALCL